MKARVAVLCLLALSVSAAAWAQAGGTSASGSVWGKITDQTGAVLPGVTVTVEGPSLMGIPTAVSNAQGVYRFPSLPPGEFKLTFTLSGFNTLVRGGITLTIGFTATVDATLKVSTIAETIEVTGQSPVVDAVNARVQTSFTKETLAAMPAARDMWAILSASPAVQMGRIEDAQPHITQSRPAVRPLRAHVP